MDARRSAGTRAARALVRACVLPGICAPLLAGCAYYNGMYNANRYTRQAERSERAGRTGEAAERWRLAAIHAESVSVRHPGSRWADDALLIRGRALVHLENWNDAVAVLQRAVREAADVEQRREAWLNLGRANLAIRRYDEALSALDSAAPTAHAARRSEVRLYRGRTWMALGRAAEALADFTASATLDARYERPPAALALGDTAQASGFAEALLPWPYRETAWLAILDGLGRSGAGRQTGMLVDQLVARRDITAGARARLFLAEGDRLARAGDAAGAQARYRDATAAAPDSAEARLVAVREARQALRLARDTAQAADARGQLEQLAEQGGVPGQEAQESIRLLRRADSLAAAAEAPDAYWFLLGELLRDSLGARMLAADVFADMADRFPESPWTPKGLLAAVLAGHPAADSLRDVLRTRYVDSPYTRIAEGHGDAPERFAVLEDSLARILAGHLVTDARSLAGDDAAGTRNGPPREGRPATAVPSRPAPGGRANPEP